MQQVIMDIIEKMNQRPLLKLTNGDTLGAAMEVQTEDEARAFKAAYVEYLRELHASTGYQEHAPEDVANINIGYWSGYFDTETARRVLRLFHTKHPVFGKTRPDAQTALEAGMNQPEQGEGRS